MMDADFIFRTDADSSSSSSPFVSFVSLWSILPRLRVSVVGSTFFLSWGCGIMKRAVTPARTTSARGMVGPARNTVGALGLAGRFCQG